MLLLFCNPKESNIFYDALHIVFKTKLCVCLMGHFKKYLITHYCVYIIINFHFYIYRFTRAEEMDDEVTQIFKKWKLNNPPLPKQNGSENINNSRNETFDTRTFTRPTRRKTFNINDHLTSAALKSSFSMSGTQPTNSMAEMQSMESGVSLISIIVSLQK